MKPSWPPRTAICLDCRTALPAGLPCPAGHARTASLADRAGREELMTEVWGPRDLRKQVREAARAGTTSSCTGSLFDCGGCDFIGGDLGEVLIALVVLFAAGVLIWAIAKGIAALVRWSRARPRPQGAARPGADAGYTTRRPGTVVPRGGLAADPVTGSPCVGFAAALEHRASFWRRPVTMLRDGASLGFDVVLDSGERVRIPPGPLIVDLRATRAARVDRLRLALYLSELDTVRPPVDDDRDPFHSNLVRAIQIRPGDRVEVLGAFQPHPVAGGSETGYREAAHVLVPAGVPRLRRLTGQGRRRRRRRRSMPAISSAQSADEVPAEVEQPAAASSPPWSPSVGSSALSSSPPELSGSSSPSVSASCMMR
jgi:hypothetical protein